MNWRRIWWPVVGGWLALLVATLASGMALARENVLTIWHVHTQVAPRKAIEAAIAEFTRRHPDMRVEQTIRELEDLTGMVKAALSAGRGPDIMTLNNGETMMGPLFRAGYVESLEPYAQKYGWAGKLLSPGLLNRARYSADGTVFGTGQLLAVPMSGELVGVYYNKDIFRQFGLSVPRDVTELEQILAKVQSAGVFPLAYGGLDRWQFFHLYGALQAASLTHQLGPDAAQRYLDDIVLHWSSERSWVTEANREAAARLQEWVRRGYLIPGFSGLNGDDAAALFSAGKAALFVQGSWYVSNFVTEGRAEFGFFPFPPYVAAEGLPPQIGGMATPLGINKFSPNKDLAAEFLDILVASDTTAQIMLEYGDLPVRLPIDLARVKPNSLWYDLYSAWNEVNRLNRVAHYLDWTTSTMWDTLGNAGVDLLALKITPETFLDRVEKDYQAWLKAKPKPAGK